MCDVILHGSTKLYHPYQGFGWREGWGRLDVEGGGDTTQYRTWEVPATHSEPLWQYIINVLDTLE